MDLSNNKKYYDFINNNYRQLYNHKILNDIYDKSFPENEEIKKKLKLGDINIDIIMQKVDDKNLDYFNKIFDAKDDLTIKFIQFYIIKKSENELIYPNLNSYLDKLKDTISDDLEKFIKGFKSIVQKNIHLKRINEKRMKKAKLYYNAIFKIKEDFNINIIDNKIKDLALVAINSSNAVSYILNNNFDKDMLKRHLDEDIVDNLNLKSSAHFDLSSTKVLEKNSLDKLEEIKYSETSYFVGGFNDDFENLF